MIIHIHDQRFDCLHFSQMKAVNFTNALSTFDLTTTITQSDATVL